MRTLDLAKAVPPDEPLIVLVDGQEHRVAKLTVWQVLELSGLDESDPSELAKIREMLERALPTLPKERMDALTVAEYAALVQFVMTGERERSEPSDRPTMPEQPSTPSSAG